MAIGDNVAVVLFEAAGEAVVAVAIADKIKKLRALGVQSRFQRAFSRIADWPRWQSRKAIRVIGRVHGQVGVMEASLIGAREQLRVDHAWIGVERYISRQPVVVDAGHAPPFLGSTPLFFDDRGPGHNLVYILVHIRVGPRVWARGGV